ncbi:alpha/beta hydrolase [Neisseriaceae bacterium TC5R-5]|nr:alpha/beta hydrolase [Neisseriaceae bacterium TC5R-5]
MLEDDITLITVPGWGGSGPQHWQTLWERNYPLALRVEQDDWLYPDSRAWVAGIERTVQQVEGKWLLVAHSLGCHATLLWWQTLSLLQQRRVKGLLLVAPPALPISADYARASGELAADMPLPQFSGFSEVSRSRPTAPTLLVASRNDPSCDYAESERMAVLWACRLVDAGACGHLGVASGVRDWPQGQRLLQWLMLV